MEIPADGWRLNVGCGRHVLPGWVNIDVVVSTEAPGPPEILADARAIPLPDDCARELLAIHLWEHFYPWECEGALAEWRRLLRRGGLLVLEMPDLFKFCQNILDGRMKGGKAPDQLGMWGLYGDPRTKDPLMMHRWGWTYKTIAPFLEARGFTSVVERPTQWHPAGREHRDFRVEARKA